MLVESRSTVVTSARPDASSHSAEKATEFTSGTTANRRLDHHQLILPAGVVLACLPWLAEVDDRFQAILIGIQILACSIGIVSSYATGLRPVRMVFFVFLFAWLGIGPLYQLSHHQLAWGDSGLLRRTGAVDGALGLTLTATLIASVAMWHAGRTRPVSPAGDGTAVTPRRWAPWTFLGLLLALTPYVIATNGGLSSLFSSRQSRVSDLSAAGVTLQQSGGTQVAVAVILPAALAVATTHLFLLRIRTSRSGPVMGTALLDALGLAGGLVGMVLFTNPLSNTRFISIAAFGSVALALIGPRSPRAGRWFALMLAVATLGIYPLSNALASDSGQAAGQPVLAVFAGKDFDGFQQTINSIAYVHDHGYSLGRYTISAVLFFVPRSMWSWKATPSAIDVAANRGYWFTNLSMPVHSEMYLEFGVVGVVVFAAAVGHAWSRIDDAWLHRPGSRSAWLVPYLSLAELGIIRGPLGSLAPVWLTVLILLAVGVVRRPVAGGPPAGGPSGGQPPPAARVRDAAPNFLLRRRRLPAVPRPDRSPPARAQAPLPAPPSPLRGDT